MQTASNTQNIELPESKQDLLMWAMLYSDIERNFQNYYYQHHTQRDTLPRSAAVKDITEWIFRVCEFAPESVVLVSDTRPFDVLKINGITICRLMHDTKKYRTIKRLLKKA
jgi:hypothetical protein